LFEGHIIEHKKTQNSRARIETILKLAGIKLPSDDIDDIGVYSDKVALDFPPPVVSGIREVLEVLAEKYRLAVICNTGWHSSGTVRQLLKDKDLPKYFSHLTFSDEAGVAKPHTQIFEYTVDKLGCSPEDAVHIGDSEYSDIVGAKQAHMRAILFTGINPKWKDDNTADLVVSSYDNFLDVLEGMNW
jgi:putative hydrolase of the HAD superfamily